MNREIFKLKASVIISASNTSGNEKLDAIMDLHDKILALNQPAQLEGLRKEFMQEFAMEKNSGAPTYSRYMVWSSITSPADIFNWFAQRITLSESMEPDGYIVGIHFCKTIEEAFGMGKSIVPAPVYFSPVASRMAQGAGMQLSEIISPEKFRFLAKWLDEHDRLTGFSIDRNKVQNDLKKFADALEQLNESPPIAEGGKDALQRYLQSLISDYSQLLTIDEVKENQTLYVAYNSFIKELKSLENISLRSKQGDGLQILYKELQERLSYLEERRYTGEGATFKIEELSLVIVRLQQLMLQSLPAAPQQTKQEEGDEMC